MSLLSLPSKQHSGSSPLLPPRCSSLKPSYRTPPPRPPPPPQQMDRRRVVIFLEGCLYNPGNVIKKSLSFCLELRVNWLTSLLPVCTEASEWSQRLLRATGLVLSPVAFCDSAVGAETEKDTVFMRSGKHVQTHTQTHTPTPSIYALRTAEKDTLQSTMWGHGTQHTTCVACRNQTFFGIVRTCPQTRAHSLV